MGRKPHFYGLQWEVDTLSKNTKYNRREYTRSYVKKKNSTNWVLFPFQETSSVVDEEINMRSTGSAKNDAFVAEREQEQERERGRGRTRRWVFK
jgi:hypothetical protein